VLAGNTPVLVHNVGCGPGGILEGPAPKNAYDMLARVDGRPGGIGKVPGYRGNRGYGNANGILGRTDAAGDPIKYKEWDVNPIPNDPNASLTDERLVTGSDGSAYYTNDHYENFFRLR